MPSDFLRTSLKTNIIVKLIKFVMRATKHGHTEFLMEGSEFEKLKERKSGRQFLSLEAEYVCKSIAVLHHGSAKRLKYQAKKLYITNTFYQNAYHRLSLDTYHVKLKSPRHSVQP